MIQTNECNIFLVPNYNKETYSAVYSDEPVENAVPFLKEQEYPVEFWYHRTDLNGCLILECEEIKNREELLSILGFAGSAGWHGFRIWNFDIRNECDRSVRFVIDMSYDREKRIHRQTMLMITADMMGDEFDISEYDSEFESNDFDSLC